MGNRSIFRQAFMGAPSARRPFAVKPITLALNSWEITPEELRKVSAKVISQGFSGSVPQIIKTIDGEFAISGNSAQFFPLGLSPDSPFQI